MKRAHTYAAILICGLIIGWYARDSVHGSDFGRGTILRLKESPQSLVSPILACETGTEAVFSELSPIKSRIETIVAEAQKNGAVEDASVYVRALNSGRWFEIGGGKMYTPASLFKIFVMLAYFKDADENSEGHLQQTLTFTKEDAATVQAHYGGGEGILKIEGEYTIEALIEDMIVHSDNDAYYVLVKEMDSHVKESFSTMLSDLGIPIPESGMGSDTEFLTDEQYSLVFRVLYGSTYLSRATSVKALTILSKASYKDGIVAGIPEGVTIAHKYGYRELTAPDKEGATVQLHDCGIVYLTKHPYLICIMSEGRDVRALTTFIQNVSKEAYESLSALFRAEDAKKKS